MGDGGGTGDIQYSIYPLYIIWEMEEGQGTFNIAYISAVYNMGDGGGTGDIQYSMYPLYIIWVMEEG